MRRLWQSAEADTNTASFLFHPSQAIGRLLFKQPGLLPVLLDGSQDAEARWGTTPAAAGCVPGMLGSLSTRRRVELPLGSAPYLHGLPCPRPATPSQVAPRCAFHAVRAVHAARRLLDRWVLLGGARDIVEMFMPAMGSLGRWAWAGDGGSGVNMGQARSAKELRQLDERCPCTGRLCLDVVADYDSPRRRRPCCLAQGAAPPRRRHAVQPAVRRHGAAAAHA